MPKAGTREFWKEHKVLALLHRGVAKIDTHLWVGGKGLDRGQDAVGSCWQMKSPRFVLQIVFRGVKPSDF